MALPYFLNRTICQFAANNAQTQLKAFSDVQSLIVLVSSDNTETIRRYQWARQHFVHLKLLAFVQFTNEKKMEHQFHNGVLKVSKRSFTFWGKPLPALQNLLRNNTFDLLINADEHNQLYLHALSGVIRAGIKIGSPVGNCKALYPVSIYARETPDFKDYMLQCQMYLDALAGKP